MRATTTSRRLRIAATAASLLVVPMTLAACTSFFGGPDELIVTGGASSKPATVSAGAAAAAISEYRKSRGLPSISVDPKLMAVAAAHSKRMAGAGRMTHVLPGEGNLPSRLRAGGYDAAVAVENIAAGPKNLDQVMTAWKRSPGHNANLLRKGVTGMGIAVSYTAKGKFNDYWTLVLAVRDERPAAAGPDAGPIVAVPR